MGNYNSKYTGAQIDAILDSIQISNPLKDYELYGYRKCKYDSNPYNRVHYIEDNINYKPAGMNYTKNVFDYGDWKNAFFMKVKPCILNYDGTVAYYLDPDDYTKKEDGTTASDAKNTSYNGNVMIQFPKIWVKRETIGIWEYVWISDKKIDDDFHCYSNIDCEGNEIDHFYYPAYEGSIVSGRLRSMSGLTLTTNTTVTQEMDAASANNLSGEHIWCTNVVADWMLICDLLRLIGQTTNVQKTFGMGHYTDGSSVSDLLKSGTMDTRGLFWGSSSSGYGVKVFGIENFWGNRWERIAGWIYKSSTQYVKMTYDTSDGSTATGYNQDGTGYIAIPNSSISVGTNGGVIKNGIENQYGFFPVSVGGNSDAEMETFECDGCWTNDSQIDYVLVGGGCGSGLLVGLAVSLNNAPSDAYWGIGGSSSCKPKAP